jgi:hypothetical protein
MSVLKHKLPGFTLLPSLWRRKGGRESVREEREERGGEREQREEKEKGERQGEKVSLINYTNRKILGK